MKNTTPFVSCLALAFTLLVLATAGMPLGLIARPRPPLPLPEFAPLLSRAGFDEPFWARTEKPESFHPAYSDLVDGWSGYALRRARLAVTPFVVPALDESGHTNVACASGAVRFWFKPDWSSGAGPGGPARLIELSAVGETDAVAGWALVVSADGATLALAGLAGDLVRAEIDWQAGEWHSVTLNYGPKGSALFLDGRLAAQGAGVPAIPPAVAALTVGSTLAGADAAQGEFDEVAFFARPLTEIAVAFGHQLYAASAARGAISAEEEAALREAAAKRRAEREAAGAGGGTQMLRLLGGTTECITNQPLYITNMVCTNISGQGWTATFDVQGTNAYGPLHDIFTTTNLTGNSVTNAQWTWLERGPACSTYQYTNQLGTFAFYILGTLLDTDNDGLTDAYENLVSKTSPTNANCPRVLYETVISNQVPSGWFKLNDSSFTNSAASGGLSLTYQGGGWSPDVFAYGNSAYSFTNNTDRLGVPNDAIGGGTGDATNQGSFTLLFKALTRQATSKRYVLSQGTATSNAIAVYFDGTGTNGALKVGVGPNEPIILQDSNLVRGAWYYLAVTCDEMRTNSNEVRWYLGRVGSQALQAGSFALGSAKKFGNNGFITLGNKENGSSAFRESASINGAIDQVAFWKRELTEAEVNAQFNTMFPLFQGASTVFDLTRWELTLPVDETNQLDNAQQPLDINTVWLNSGFKYVDPADAKQKYFYLSNGSQMVFEAPWNGADQDSSSPATKLGSPRSELRETLTNGNEFNWKPYDPATGTATNTHTLQATCRLESVPSKVIFGQIHADTPSPAGGAVPAVTLFHEGSGTANKRIRLSVYYSPDRSVTNSGGAQTYDIVSGVNLGDRIDYELKLVGTSNSTIRLSATVATNGTSVTPLTVNMSNPADPLYSGWAATNVTLYFKAGCYFPTAATNSGTAKVTFSSLTVTHQP